ncbi:MAG: hypothetical protein RL264_1376 [Bacteroidota bacterium]|jgi:predicted AlkP superfamily pyrophosphatase or phosphodiesterase
MRFIPYLFLVVLAFSCSDKFNPKKELRSNCRTSVSNLKILFIGIDGVRTDALLAANTPNIDTLMNHGYVCLNVDRGPHTVSVPGWSTILHGVWPAKHNLTENSFRKNRYSQYPDMLSMIRSNMPSMSLATLSNWDDFLRLTEEEDYAAVFESDAEVKNRALELFQNCNPDVMLLHFDAPDHEGHDTGFDPNNSAYIQAIETTDQYVGELMEFVYNQENSTQNRYLVVLTTDHGGSGTGHGGQDDLDVTRKVWGIIRKPEIQNQILIESANAVDLLPSMLSWLGVTKPSNLDGQAWW